MFFSNKCDKRPVNRDPVQEIASLSSILAAELHISTRSLEECEYFPKLLSFCLETTQKVNTKEITSYRMDNEARYARRSPIQIFIKYWTSLTLYQLKFVSSVNDQRFPNSKLF
jgi:hypothetical protein